HFGIVEDDQVFRLEAGIDRLPVLVIGHHRNAVGLLLDERLHVEALLQHGDAVRPTFGRKAELVHPGEEWILIAEAPDAERVALEAGFGLPRAVLRTNEAP